MSFTTHIDIISRLRDRENQAWEDFFDSYAQLIRLHGRDCGVKEENLDDLVQDVMLAVTRKSATFQYDPGKGRFRDYLKKIIRAKAADILRGHYRREAPLLHVADTAKLDLIPDEALPPDQALDRDFAGEWKNLFVKDCMRLLREKVNLKHYQIFFLLEVRKLPASQVAAFSGLSLVTVYCIRSRMERALAGIAGNLAANVPEGEIYRRAGK